MINKLQSSNIFNTIIMICIVIIGILFMGYGCGNSNTLTPEEEVDGYGGKWELTYAALPDSSNLVHKQWLTLNADQSFNCTSSFFWDNDSTRMRPLVGTWNVSDYHINSHSTARAINFHVNSITHSWDISGSNKSGYLWFENNYKWVLVKH